MCVLMKYGYGKVKETVKNSDTITIKHDGTTKKGQSLLEVEMETEGEACCVVQGVKWEGRLKIRWIQLWML